MADLVRWGDIERGIDGIQKVLDDPKLLRPFAKRLQERVKKFIEGEGEGSWPPPAQSTLKKWQYTGSSDVTKHNTIRVNKLRSLDKQIKKLAQRTSKGGWSDSDRRKVERLKKRARKLRRAPGLAAERAATAEGRSAKLRAQAARLTDQIDGMNEKRGPKGAKAVELRRKRMERLEKLQGQQKRADEKEQAAKFATTYKGRQIGKRQSETKKLMGRMPSTIRAVVKRAEMGRGLIVHVYSKAGKVGYLHDQGQAKNAPKRTIIPEPTTDDMDFLVELVEQAAVDAWDES